MEGWLGCRSSGWHMKTLWCRREDWSARGCSLESLQRNVNLTNVGKCWGPVESSQLPVALAVSQSIIMPVGNGTLSFRHEERLHISACATVSRIAYSCSVTWWKTFAMFAPRDTRSLINSPVLSFRNCFYRSELTPVVSLLCFFRGVHVLDVGQRLS